MGGSWAGRYFGMDAARNWAEGEETDETIREDMGGEATVGTGPRRAARGVITALPPGVEGYLRGEPGGLWRGGGLVDKRDEGCCVISGSARNGVGLPRCR